MTTIIILSRKDIMPANDKVAAARLKPHHFMLGQEAALSADVIVFRNGNGVEYTLKDRYNEWPGILNTI